ncbi:polysaccharide deacetylase family protein [Marinitenerispora sediminis]|uniref:Polysaccharide deacetylase family protein n=1 Tax=Marinitenerispora sediminis TaxID=1931232 RepID=A0A368T2S1_9ACTN|nr:polysaccharide deacetylase family protein [Marinitenerispora sediminis]RCV48796.1 polysaccharide deacetylase family protein [Marinitenerispora sediminis]RCV50678.1 polysaccharide deacetylase family protein [Marinitenerispora sediminis]
MLRARLPGRAGATRRPRLCAPVFRIVTPDRAGAPLALTVDDGPDPRWTPMLLDVLAAHRVPATFFVVGARVTRHPELVRRVADAGHAIGNHTMTHPQPFAALPRSEIRREISGTQEAVRAAAGRAPTLFRAPAGGWSWTVLTTAREHGLTPVDWSIDPKDWREPGVRHVTRVLTSARPGDVMLCHDGGGDRSATVAAVDAALGALLRRGYRFTAL